MKIWRKRITDLMNQSINEEAVYRTAPATPGLLIMMKMKLELKREREINMEIKMKITIKNMM